MCSSVWVESRYVWGLGKGIRRLPFYRAELLEGLEMCGGDMDCDLDWDLRRRCLVLLLEGGTWERSEMDAVTLLHVL
jgi:hypothetical protein